MLTCCDVQKTNSELRCSSVEAADRVYAGDPVPRGTMLVTPKRNVNMCKRKEGGRLEPPPNKPKNKSTMNVYFIIFKMNLKILLF